MNRTKSILCLFVLVSFLFSACGNAETAVSPENTASEEPAVTESPAADTATGPNGEVSIDGISFYGDTSVNDNARVFYEIFVGSFSDSNGDGVGDLRGIINRMDYLNDGDPASGLSLGVEGIWLTPIFQSRSYHKYDVLDYYTIDDDFGTTEDLQELVALCHARGMKLIIDLPINHTSTGCPWYKEFVSAQRSGDTESPYYDWYTWCPSGEIPAGRVFSQISGTSHCVECNFSGDMPELNFDSGAVREAVLEIARYYLNMGVDGFRFDAAKYIYFGDHDGSSGFWDWYLGTLREEYPEMYSVAEVWDSDGITDYYFTSTNCFNFTVSGTEGLIAGAAKGGNVSTYTAYVNSYLDRITAINPDAMFVPFVSNHDMDRAAGGLPVSMGQMQMAASLYLLSPGSPFIYYGEEIGMKGSRGSSNTDANRRLAMLWGDGDTVTDPEGTSYDASKQSNGTLAEQLGDESSLYNHYKKLLMIRSANPEIARGEYTPVDLQGTKAGGFISEWNGSRVCVIHNTTTEPVTIDLSGTGAENFTFIAAAAGFGEAELSGSILTLGALTSAVLR